jgi:hypothetical protein
MWDHKRASEAGAASGLELRLVRDHLLVKNALDANPAALGSIKHNMSPNLKPTKACLDRLAGSADERMFGENLK